MTKQKLEWRSAAKWADETRGRHGRSAAVAFVSGVVAGLFLREGLRRTQELARRKWAQREHERTVTYEDNLPDSLERREPAPQEGQPRYGGTGAIGFSPAVAAEANPSDT
jgi:hypothetical protein